LYLKNERKASKKASFEEDEEFILVKTVQNADKQKAREAMNTLLEGYKRLIIYFVKYFMPWIPGMEFGDKVNEISIIFMQCVRKHDYAYKVKLSTYFFASARKYTVGLIRDNYKMVNVPENDWKIFRRLRDLEKEGNGKNLESLAKEFGLAVSEMAEIDNFFDHQVLSLDQMMANDRDGTATLYDFISGNNGNHGIELAHNSQFKARIEKVIDYFKPLEKIIIRRVILNEEPVKEVREDLMMDVTFYRLILNRIIRKLQNPAVKKILKDFEE